MRLAGFCSSSALGLSALVLAPAWAQTTVPDAGSIRQQMERGREWPLPPATRPTQPAEPAARQPASGASVIVKVFTFTGNSLLSAEQLAAAVARFVGRPLDFGELQRAADAVAARYREAGWVVRVNLPEQDITQGQVRLHIVEAVFGGARLEGPAPRRVATAQVLAHLGARQAVGAPLNADAIDRALLLVDDLPGVSVAGTLVPGERDGETAMALHALDESAYYGEVLADNAGSRSTGADRVTAHLVLNSPAGWGDALSANLLHSSGSDYARLGYTVPVGVDGWRAGINASTMRYSVFTHTASGTSKTQGSSDSAGLEANLPLVRSRQRNLYLSLAAEQKAFQTHIVAAGGSDTLYSDYRTNNFSLGLSGNLFDVWGGGGANSASLSVQHGQLASVLAGSPQVSMAPRYTLWRWGLTRQQTVTDAHALYLSLSGQMADKDIDTSERLYLGGMSGVRAYPASEIGGAGGQLVNLEWRWRVDPSLTLVSFYDWGRAKSPGEATATVRGAGLGVGWQNPSGVYIKATWARRIGHNPRADSVTGMDGDGTLQTDRWWLSASLPF